jgi:hypothetical protein
MVSSRWLGSAHVARMRFRSRQLAEQKHDPGLSPSAGFNSRNWHALLGKHLISHYTSTNSFVMRSVKTGSKSPATSLVPGRLQNRRSLRHFGQSSKSTPTMSQQDRTAVKLTPGTQYIFACVIDVCMHSFNGCCFRFESWRIRISHV